MSRSVGLVVPALNPDVPRLDAYLTALVEHVEPAVVRVELDDPDGRYGHLADRLDAEVAVAPVRRGKGLAITHGFDALDTDIRAFVDADGSTTAPSVAALIEPLRTGSADITVGSRLHPDATVTGRSAFRGLNSATFATVARLASGIGLSDFQCGAKAVAADCWADLRGHLFEAGFGWDLEVLWLATRRDHAVVEVPIAWDEAPGTTVPPMQTALELGGLVGRIFIARALRRERLQRGGTPLVDRYPSGGT